MPYLGEANHKRGFFVGVLLFGVLAAMIGWLVIKRPGTEPAATPSGVAHTRTSAR